MNKKLAGVFVLAALFILSCGVYYLQAQMGGRPGQREGGQRPAMGMMGGMGGMGGGAAMITYGKYIYALSGGTLFKIEPVTMKIEKELSLKSKMPAGAARNRPAPADLDEE